jgi:hypothetical protein
LVTKYHFKNTASNHHFVGKVLRILERISKGLCSVALLNGPKIQISLHPHHSVRLGPYFSHSHTFTASGMALVSKHPKKYLLSFCARIEQKLSKLQKIIKIEEKVIKNLCFLLLFWNLCNLRPQWLLLGIFVQNVFETNLNFRYQQVKN